MTTTYIFTITAETPADDFPYSDEQIADIERRLGYAIRSIIQCYGSSAHMDEDWPPSQYPRTAKITLEPRIPPLEYAGDELECGDPAISSLPPYLVFSEAPPWAGEGSAAPVLRTADGYMIYL